MVFKVLHSKETETVVGFSDDFGVQVPKSEVTPANVFSVILGQRPFSDGAVADVHKEVAKVME